MSAATKTLDHLDRAEPLRSIRIPGSPSNPTRTRWVLTGIKNAAGERIRLRAWKVGGRLMTTPLDVDHFLTALNGEHVADESDADVARRGREAGRALQALGC